AWFGSADCREGIAIRSPRAVFCALTGGPSSTTRTPPLGFVSPRKTMAKFILFSVCSFDRKTAAHGERKHVSSVGPANRCASARRLARRSRHDPYLTRFWPEPYSFSTIPLRPLRGNDLALRSQYEAA